MIQNILIFVMGALAAALGALLLMPALNRRAVRLYRRQLDRTLPRTLAEIAAARDAVRAEMAAKTARVIHDRDRVIAELAAAATRAAEDQLKLRGLVAERDAAVTAIAELEARLASVHADLRTAIEANARLDADRRALERWRSEATRRQEEADSSSDEMRAALEDAEARIAALTSAVADLASERAAEAEAPPPLREPAPVIHVDFTARAPVDTTSGLPRDGQEEARIADLARRLKSLKGRRLAVTASVPSVPSEDAPRSETGPAAE